LPRFLRASSKISSTGEYQSLPALVLTLVVVLLARWSSSAESTLFSLFLRMMKDSFGQTSLPHYHTVRLHPESPSPSLVHGLSSTRHRRSLEITGLSLTPVLPLVERYFVAIGTARGPYLCTSSSFAEHLFPPPGLIMPQAAIGCHVFDTVPTPPFP